MPPELVGFLFAQLEPAFAGLPLHTHNIVCGEPALIDVLPVGMPRGARTHGAPGAAAASAAETKREVREGICATCFAKADRCCSKCKQIWFCSERCLRKGWLLGHKGDCGLDLPRQELPQVPPEYQAGMVETPVFPEASWRKLEEAAAPVGKPRGFLNLGNSCYLNAALQCLASMQPFSSFCQEHAVECGSAVPLGCFRCSLGQVFSECRPCAAPDPEAEQLRLYDANALRSLKEAQSMLPGPLQFLEGCLPPSGPQQVAQWLPRLSEGFTFGAQEDAHEFCRSILRMLGEEQMREHSQGLAVPLSGALAMSAELTAIPSRAFGGLLVSQSTCPEPQCGYSSHCFETFQDLSLEISEVTDTIEEMLQLFTAPERLDKHNRWHCNGCGKDVRARKRLMIYQAPECLVLHLKRFRMGFFGKINQEIRFQSTLNLRPFLARASDDRPLYDLRAVLVHLDKGNISHYGHYIAFVKCPLPDRWQWYAMDDERAVAVSEEDVLRQTAYLLFYVRSRRAGAKAGAPKLQRETSGSKAPQPEASEASQALRRCFGAECPFFAVSGQDLCSQCYRERHGRDPPRAPQEPEAPPPEAPAPQRAAEPQGKSKAPPASSETSAPQRAAEPQGKSKKKIGANELCPCGSGLKYKKCHGAKK